RIISPCARRALFICSSHHQNSARRSSAGTISRGTDMARRRRLTPEQAEVSRRDFMRTAACAAVGTTALVSTVWDLRLMNAAIAGGLPRVQRAGVNVASDYKALVCLFLYGGNDANNMIVPTTDVDYTNYSTARRV